MRRSILIVIFTAILGSTAWAEDVVYITTEQFRARVFDYKTEKEWKFKGENLAL